LDKRPRALLAPDPRLLLDLFPESLCTKISQAGLCFVIDDDGTISNSHPMYIDWLARKLHRPLRPEDNKHYNFSDVHPQALGMLKVGVFGKPRMHIDLPVVPGAVEALREIHRKGIPILILTARPPRSGMVRATYRHKRNHRIPFDIMIFSPRKKEIIKAIKRISRQVVVVDDDPSVATSIYQLTGVFAILFGASYNEHINRDGLVRVDKKNGNTAWDEVLSIVRRKVMNGRS